MPSEHCVSTVNLDEDVHAEMRLWRKGLVAMFEAEDEDCVFIETSKVEGGKNHLSVECIPLPRESGDLLPIYFKVILLLQSFVLFFLASIWELRALYSQEAIQTIWHKRWNRSTFNSKRLFIYCGWLWNASWICTFNWGSRQISVILWTGAFL